MADPQSYRPAPGTIPTDPGVYKFRDPAGRVIYVGKAKNLRARLSNYFQDVVGLHPRTQRMVTTASAVEWTVVSSEVEALQLEYTWIKKFDPTFNVKYRDDKSYPVLAISVAEKIPRAFFYRGPRRAKVKYFGPFSHAWAVRETLDLATRVFPMRTCSAGVYHRHELLGRPCLLGYIDKCAAPCVGKVTPTEHRAIVDEFVSFMGGRTDTVVRELTAKMNQAAEELDFEAAARLRDDLAAITTIMERQAVVLGDGTDADVIAVSADELAASIHLFHIRQGRVRGQRGWIVDRADDTDEELRGLLTGFIMQFYLDADVEVPKEVLTGIEPAEKHVVEQALAEARGRKVSLRVPQRGDKKALMETVHKNAVEALRQHKMKRVGDLTARSAALSELQEYLGMDQAPLRIECIDISHIQGTDVVGSVVVFEDGMEKKSDYRRIKITQAAGEGHSDDVASIAEVVRRRFEKFSPLEEEIERSTRFAYPPQLFIVDGGQPQVNAAAAVLAELGITGVTVIGIAKRLEEMWLPGDPWPVIVPRNSPALYLVQRIRDEAHRFALAYHRQLRSSRMKASVLDGIPGLGEKRRQALIRHFGSVAKVKKATVADIQQVPGIGPHLAEEIHRALLD